MTRTPSFVPSQIVHAFDTGSSGIGLRLLCDSSPTMRFARQRGRVMAVDHINRRVSLAETDDPVDCMSCLVAQART